MLTPGLYLVTPDQADGDALVAAVAALLPARPALVQYRNKLADAAAPPLDEQHILRLRVEMFQREMRFDGCAHCGIVPQNCIGLHGPGGCRLIPEQSDGGIGTAGGQAVLRKIMFSHTTLLCVFTQYSQNHRLSRWLE